MFIDWKSGLEPAIYVHYSTPAGRPLIHLAPDPVFMPNYPGWGFHKFNPWRERFDQLIHRAIEAGLINFWKQVWLGGSDYYSLVQKYSCCLNFPPSSHPLTWGCRCTAHQLWRNLCH